MRRVVGVLVAMLVAVPAAPAAAAEAAEAPPPLRTTTAGFVHVDDETKAAGKGRRRTYRVEIEPEVNVGVRWATAFVDRVLADPRGWTGAADWSLRRVRRDPDIRIVIATPNTVDKLCARAGLRTVGRLSCWNGRFAAINVDRWKQGAAAFPGSLRSYRRYVVNHEVGHGLGYGHRSCPRAGARAPVMQQQTLRTWPCRANGWPTRDP